MNSNEWLHKYLNDKYEITITPDLAEENLLGNIVKLTVPEVAYLLISISEYYGISVDDIMGHLSSNITYNSLSLAIAALKNKTYD